MQFNKFITTNSITNLTIFSYVFVSVSKTVCEKSAIQSYMFVGWKATGAVEFLNKSLSVGYRQHKACFESVSFHFRCSFFCTDLQFVLTGIQWGKEKKKHTPVFQEFASHLQVTSEINCAWRSRQRKMFSIEVKCSIVYIAGAILLNENNLYTKEEWNTTDLIGKIIGKRWVHSFWL